MARSSGTPLPKKLGIQESDRVVLVGAPKDFEQSLRPLPEHVRFRRQPRPPVDVIVFFTRTSAELRRRLPKLNAALAPTGGLWVAFPKATSGVPTDLVADVVKEAGVALGLEHNKAMTMDDGWQAVRFHQVEEPANSNGRA